METLWMVILWMTLIGVGYLVGSVSPGYLVGKFKEGIDIRETGSGSTGGTNIIRRYGVILGTSVILADLLKCSCLVIIAYYIIKSEMLAGVVILAAIIGNIYSCFLQFKGGKGFSTLLGGVIPLIYPSWMLVLIMAGIWALVFFLFRIMSLANLIIVLSFPAALWYLHHSWFFLIIGILAVSLVYYRHLENIKRLWRREESKLL